MAIKCYKIDNVETTSTRYGSGHFEWMEYNCIRCIVSYICIYMCVEHTNAFVAFLLVSGMWNFLVQWWNGKIGILHNANCLFDLCASPWCSRSWLIRSTALQFCNGILLVVDIGAFVGVCIPIARIQNRGRVHWTGLHMMQYGRDAVMQY